MDTAPSYLSQVTLEGLQGSSQQLHTHMATIDGFMQERGTQLAHSNAGEIGAQSVMSVYCLPSGITAVVKGSDCYDQGHYHSPFAWRGRIETLILSSNTTVHDLANQLARMLRLHTNAKPTVEHRFLLLTRDQNKKKILVTV